jgi:hypothetical protein
MFLGQIHPLPYQRSLLEASDSNMPQNVTWTDNVIPYQWSLLLTGEANLSCVEHIRLFHRLPVCDWSSYPSPIGGSRGGGGLPHIVTDMDHQRYT